MSVDLQGVGLNFGIAMAKNLTQSSNRSHRKAMSIIAISTLAMAAGSAAAVVLAGRTPAAKVVAGTATLTLNSSAPQVASVNNVAVAAAVPQAAASTNSAAVATLGMNLAAPSYWGKERSFMNLASTSEWRYSSPTVNYGTLPADHMDASGAIIRLDPGEVAIRILSAPNAAYLGKSVRIRCVWKGEGRLTLQNFVAKDWALGSNQLSFTWVPDGGQTAQVVVKSTKPDNPVRQLDCREADASPTALFHPDFIKSLSLYKTVRFMDWQNTNASKPVTWATRNTPNSSFLMSSRDGVSIEHMVALANEANVDPWFNMPWNGDDDYIRRFATYVRDNLNSDRRAYIELSNEVWNGAMFKSANQAKAEGLAAKLSDNAFIAQLSRYSQRTMEVMKIWTEVFAAKPSRIVRVIASQDGNTWTAQTVLGYGDTAKYVDALATAPYFGYDFFQGANASLTDLNKIFSLMPAYVDKAIASAYANKLIADKWKKRYITYEAGQHLINSDGNLLAAVERDPRMAEIYARYLNGWKAKVGGQLTLFMNYGGIGKFGAWGLQEYPGQPASAAPKYKAVLDFAAAN